MDVIKEFFGAIGGRLRSHFIGSILVSLLAFNWDSILFLIMDGNSVWMKIAYIEKHWQLGLPISVGILIGLLNPWIIFGGAYLAKIPSEKLSSLQDNAKHTRAMLQLEWESKENHEKSKLAKEVDEALTTIKDDDIRERLKEETSPSTKAESEAGTSLPYELDERPFGTAVLKSFDELSDLERSIIKRMGKRHGILLTIVQNADLSTPVQIDGQAAPKASLDEYTASVENLLNFGLVESKIPHANKVSVFELSHFGVGISNLLTRQPNG